MAVNSPRRLTAHTTLENLKKEAKRWLKALRAAEAAAHARYARAYPEGTSTPGLRDVQHALAREYGFAGWTALKEAVTALPAASAAVARNAMPREQLVARFLDYACPDHHVRGRPAHRMARHAAMRLLQQHPEIARADLSTAVVCGEIEEVER